MAIKEINLDKIPSQDDVLTISKSGINFSSQFIKKNNLEKMQSIKFLEDDDDRYWLGFEFLKDTGARNALGLVALQKTFSRFLKASELINKNQILSTIQKNENKFSRTFEIKKEKGAEYFYILLRPSFELSQLFENRNVLDNEIVGIYRYLDRDGKIIYIGKGVIKNRANSPERKEWGVVKIEYSVLKDDDVSYRWESHYIDAYVNEHGVKPFYNRVSGHGSV